MIERAAKECPDCHNDFYPYTTIEKRCIPCAIKKVNEKKSREYTKETRRLKREYYDNDPKHWKQKAQKAFHAYIRERDSGDPCISCGRYHTGQYHAGHYKTRHAQSAIQFHEFNCHKQCAPCNVNLSGNITKYRPRLIEKIGLAMVEYLELDHGSYKWTLDDYKVVYEHYRDKLNELQS